MNQTAGHYDVIIIGGGPAGLSAALWCSDLGLHAVLLEREAEFGGQLLSTFNPIENYLGARAANGAELRDKFLRDIEQVDADRFFQADVVTVDLEKKKIELAGGKELSADAIIIATGVRRRTLNVPGEKEFIGRGILQSGAKDKSRVVGKHVVIIGGGDAALENALILGETAKKVTMVHRNQEFRGRKDFIEQTRQRENIDFIFNSRVLSITGRDTLKSVEIENTVDGTRSKIPTDAVLVRIGVEPNTELYQNQIELDSQGYIVRGNENQTSIPMVFAIGDAANPISKTISTAAGEGATAAKVIAKYISPES